jgi:hypothetical protein
MDEWILMMVSKFPVVNSRSSVIPLLIRRQVLRQSLGLYQSSQHCHFLELPIDVLFDSLSSHKKLKVNPGLLAISHSSILMLSSKNYIKQTT